MDLTQLFSPFNSANSPLTRTKLCCQQEWPFQLPLKKSPLFAFLKGALTYFLGCVAKEYVCGITWKFFATHRSFYNTALVINIEIEQ